MYNDNIANKIIHICNPSLWILFQKNEDKHFDKNIKLYKA